MLERNDIERPASMPIHSRDVARMGQGRTRLLAGTCTVALHLLVVGAAIWLRVSPPAVTQPVQAIMVSVVQQSKQPQPTPLPGVALLEPSAPSAPVLPRLTFSPVATTIQVSSSDAPNLLSDAELAGAVRAGEGGGGGGCDMARAVQQALRQGPLVRAAVDDARLRGRAILLWDGDWVQAGGQEGKGLSAAREAVLWAVAFAPQACRDAPMHGLVLLSLNDGNTRFVVGVAGRGNTDWRWSDLLGLPPAAR